MITPAARPVSTEKDSPSQFSICSAQRIMNDAMAISTADTLVPMPNERNRSFIVAPSLVFTMNIPMSDRKMPTEAIIIGAITAFICMSPLRAKAVAPRAAVLRMLPQ